MGGPRVMDSRSQERMNAGSRERRAARRGGEQRLHCDPTTARPAELASWSSSSSSMQGARGVPGLRWGREGALLRRRAGSSHHAASAAGDSGYHCQPWRLSVSPSGRPWRRRVSIPSRSLHSFPTSHLARWRAAQPLHRRLTTSATTAVPPVKLPGLAPPIIWRSRRLGRRLLRRAAKQPPLPPLICHFIHGPAHYSRSRPSCPSCCPARVAVTAQADGTPPRPMGGERREAGGEGAA